VFDARSEPVASLQPDPPRAAPPRLGQVLGLVRTLIAYGKNLATTLRQHAADPHVLPCFAFVANIFGTTDLAPIFARLVRGVLRAAALEAWLTKRAALGRDLTPTSIRLPSRREPHAAKPAVPPAEDPSLTSPPTVEQILAKDRRRPIGAVLVDICLDLGIVPGQMDYATWDELRRDIIEYGGSLVTLLCSRARNHRSAIRTGSPSPGLASIPITGPVPFPAWPVPFPKSPAPACTGPP
jgi:hypothetical protein